MNGTYIWNKKKMTEFLFFYFNKNLTNNLNFSQFFVLYYV
jgi:hypothetical protein